MNVTTRSVFPRVSLWHFRATSITCSQFPSRIVPAAVRVASTRRNNFDQLGDVPTDGSPEPQGNDTQFVQHSDLHAIRIIGQASGAGSETQTLNRAYRIPLVAMRSLCLAAPLFVPIFTTQQNVPLCSRVKKLTALYAVGSVTAGRFF